MPNDLLINPEIMVADYEDTYLIKYISDYYLGFILDNETILTDKLSLSPITSLYDIVISDDYEGIEELEKKSEKNKPEKDLIFLHSLINSRFPSNSETILQELIMTMDTISYEVKHYDDSRTNAVNNITDNKIINKIKAIDEEVTRRINSKLFIADKGKGTYIYQIKDNDILKDGLYYQIVQKDKNGEINEEYKLIGNIIINELTLIYDKLGLFNPVTTIKYTNTVTNQSITLEKQPYEAIASNIINNRLIDSTSQGVENLLNKIWVQGVNNIDFITAETDLLKDGFFMDMETHKVLSNNVFENLKTSKKDIQEAINLFNEIIINRGNAIPNDCLLFRFMLWSPFGYCLKQLGFTDGLYSMVLWGVTDTSKTGSSVIFSNLYTDKSTTLQKANTQSAIGTRLGENTFPLILDEAKDNLINPNDEEFNKNIVTDVIGRAVKDRANNNLMTEFPALRMTVRTLNQDIEYKAEFLKRHHVLYYDGSMQVNEDNKIEFNKKFKPKSPNTPLKNLRHLGKAFADRFIPYLEKQSDELYDLDKLTIKILKEINEEYNGNFNINVFLPHNDRLTTTQTTDTAMIIRNALNKMFTKAYKIPFNRNKYELIDFIDSTDKGAIIWLDYQPKNSLFVIKVNEFEKDISQIVGQHIPISEVMNLLDIKYDDNNGKVIKFKNTTTKAIKLNAYDLTYKLFNIRVEEFNELEAEAEEIQQREAEAEAILNRKPLS